MEMYIRGIRVIEREYIGIMDVGGGMVCLFCEVFVERSDCTSKWRVSNYYIFIEFLCKSNYKGKNNMKRRRVCYENEKRETYFMYYAFDTCNEFWK